MPEVIPVSKHEVSRSLFIHLDGVINNFSPQVLLTIHRLPLSLLGYKGHYWS